MGPQCQALLFSRLFGYLGSLEIPYEVGWVLYLYRTVIGILTGIALKDLNFNLGVSVAASPICVCACVHVCAGSP